METIVATSIEGTTFVNGTCDLNSSSVDDVLRVMQYAHGVPVDGLDAVNKWFSNMFLKECWFDVTAAHYTDEGHSEWHIMGQLVSTGKRWAFHWDSEAGEFKVAML